jgi:hypothetical protein
MDTKISLGLICAIAFAVCACHSNAVANVNNALSAPEHANTSTEPAGKGSPSASPSSAK